MSRYNLRERRTIDYSEIDCDSSDLPQEQTCTGYRLSEELTKFKNEIRFKVLKQLKHKKSINRHIKIQISTGLMQHLKANFKITKRFGSNENFIKEFEFENLKAYFETFFCFIVEKTVFVRFSTETKLNCFLDERRSNRIIMHSPYSYCCIKFCVDSLSSLTF
jgi:hypothetical protein